MNEELKCFLGDKEVVDVSEVLKITRMNNNKLYELLRYNLFPKPIRVKNKNFWYRSEIEAYLLANKKIDSPKESE